MVRRGSSSFKSTASVALMMPAPTRTTSGWLVSVLIIFLLIWSLSCRDIGPDHFRRIDHAVEWCNVLSIASDEHRVWRSHSQEAKRGETSGHRITRHGEAMGSFLLPCAPPGCPSSREGAR